MLKGKLFFKELIINDLQILLKLKNELVKNFNFQQNQLACQITTKKRI